MANQPQQPQPQGQPQQQGAAPAHQQAEQALANLGQAHGLTGVDWGQLLPLIFQLIQALRNQPQANP